jgi:[acyl-carrier-protein] S-malonyltransferase
MTTAFLFPGQGAQHVGMGADLYDMSVLVRSAFDRVSERLGEDVAAIAFKGHRTALNRTDIAQAAIFAVSVGVAGILREAGIGGSMVAGHSLGELSATVAVGAIEPDDGARLAACRGLAMLAASDKGEGRMIALGGISGENVKRLCEEADHDVWAVNYNAPSQTVISGTADGVDHVAERAGRNGAKVTRLAVTGAFHTPMMAEATDTFFAAVAATSFAHPATPLVVEERRLEDADTIRDQLANQMTAPVRWIDTMRSLGRMGAERFVEVGPGSVLKGLALRNDRKAVVFTTGNVRDLERTLHALA